MATPANSSMEKYRRVPKTKEGDSGIMENEIRITSMGKVHNYIAYANTLLVEKGATEIVIRAMGHAINKTVTIAEIIKRRIAGLHQITEISSTPIVDQWEPTEAGLATVETKRNVSSVMIRLSRAPLDSTHVGYQPPLPEDQIRQQESFAPHPDAVEGGAERPNNGGRGRRGRRGGGRGRGGRGGFRGGRGGAPRPYGDDHPVTDMHVSNAPVLGAAPIQSDTEPQQFPGNENARGRGRGRGRGRRGRGHRGGRGGRNASGDAQPPPPQETTPQ